METFLIKAAQLLLSLSLLVVIHEFGHFIFARLFKIRVEKFYLFFDPWFSLFKFKPKGSDTEYGIGWLPLGGYVKISGMVDESMDKEQLAQAAKPWEFRSKPTWQRLLVMVGGVLFNFLLAMFIFSMMLFAWGDSYISLKDYEQGMEFPAVVKKAGFQTGDVLVGADGEDFQMRDGVLSLNTLVSFLNANEVQVKRNGVPQTIILPQGFGDSVLASKEAPYLFIPSAVIGKVEKGSIAESIGIQIGDSITQINGVPVRNAIEMYDRIKSVGVDLKDDQTQEMPISLYRKGVEHNLVAIMDTANVLGVMGQASAIHEHKIHYGFFASFPAGMKMGVDMLKAYIGQMKYVFSKEGAKNVGGFGAIGNMFPAQWNWNAFWTMTAFLSLALAFLNILPIPLLDGGHIVFLLYEMITRRPPNEKFQEYAQMAGMILLFGLLLWANGNDIIRYIFN